MSRAVNGLQASLSRRKGGIEVSTLTKWIILLVFLIVVLLIIVAVKTSGDGLLDSLCEKSGGMFGC